MLTQDRLFSQVRTPKVWDEVTLQAEIGDYFHLPYTPIMQVIEKETLSNGRVWLQVKPRSGSYSEEWILQPETLEQHLSEQQRLSQQDETEVEQPVALTLDSLSCQLQPTQIVDVEFEQGRCHGQLDAAERGHPIYAKASCSYSQGYLKGYQNTLNPPQKPQLEVTKQKEWAVTYNSKWDWYIVWVGDHAVDRAANASEGEQIAQRYIAGNKFWQEHRERVLAAYAG